MGKVKAFFSRGQQHPFFRTSDAAAAGNEIQWTPIYVNFLVMNTLSFQADWVFFPFMWIFAYCGLAKKFTLTGAERSLVEYVLLNRTTHGVQVLVSSMGVKIRVVVGVL